MAAKVSVVLSERGVAAVEAELRGEKVASLGRTERQMEAALAKLRECPVGADGRSEVLRAAAWSVYAFFVQREAMGTYRHADVVEQYRIPPEVLGRLGAR